MTPQVPHPADVQATFCAVLVDAVIAAGLRHVVVAPGSRSTPLALAFTNRVELAVQVAHDERTAAFMALGVGVSTGRPAAVLCTSGTAAVHFHAAVVEAHLSSVPLLVFTADRPPELHDVGAAQTIDQQRLFGSAVRWFHDPGVADATAVASWRSLGQRAYSATLGAHPGPVHLNLPFREPLVGEVHEGLYAAAGHVTPHTVVGTALLADADLAALTDVLATEVRGVIIAGRSGADPDAVGAVAEALKWPVLVEPRSGCGSLPNAVRAFDALLRDAVFAADHAPKVVLRVGEPVASKVTNQWLASAEAIEVHISPVPAVIDPDHRAHWRLVADPTDTLGRLARAVSGRGGSATPWLARWLHAERHAQNAIEAWCEAQPHLTEPAVARTLLTALPLGWHLVVASSMPIRDVEWFGGAGAGVTVHANRGANGIDGVVATGIGVAWATGEPTVVLLGDVALLHDASSLTALAGRGLDVRIVVVDNDGGGIFSFLPQATALAEDRFEQVFGTPHGTDLEMLARAHHLQASTVTSVDALGQALGRPGPSLIRVPSDRALNVRAHADLNAAARPR
jgi:2-succinyl-5-enolpyruvyl-6-hydroxy-3-cyclohexene-1-carboxylate synthase